MGFLGSERGLTPNLDDLAHQATIFSRAYAQVPLTTPSHAGILTGTYPPFNHVNYMGDPLGRNLPFLPEILHRRGYRTAAFVGGLALEPKSIAPGFDRGFDVYDAGFNRRPGRDRYHSLERRGEEVVRHALAWLNTRSAGPFFLWVHLYDPHDPYDPPEPYKTRYQAAPYDGEIASSDAAVAKLLAGLRTQHLFDAALIAVMADHGEAFGEHGENHHGIFLYDETVRVPLILKLPGQRTAQRVETPVGLVDVAPTVLRVANFAIPAAMQGESLLGVIKPNHPDSRRSVYSESDYGHRSFGWSTVRAWRTEKYLYIDAPQRELYETSIDPAASHNLDRDFKAVADTAAAQLAEFHRMTQGNQSERTALSPEQTESLHALGYLSPDRQATSTTGDGGGADPKDKIAIANLLYRALVATENDKYEEAIPVLEEVLRQEPKTAMASLQLGRAYMFVKQYQKALAPLQELVEERPDNAVARYELGCALVKTGHWNEAAPQFEAAASQMDSSSMMHFYLALVYERTSRNDQALVEFQNALRRDPENFPANLMLGRMFVKHEKPVDALPYLQKAATLRPDATDPHQFMADAYTQLGKQASASRELSEAERIQSHGGSRLGTQPGDRTEEKR